MAAATAVSWVGPRDHVVQFYRDDEELAGQAGGYLLEAVRDGGAAVVIATRAHRLAFEARLADAGIDVTAAQAHGDYWAFDAEQTLRRFMAGGRLDAAAFDAVVGGLIRQVASGGRPVRAYGEMVALLWDAGLVAAAVELEALWSDLGRQHRFSLFCAYPAASVTRESHAAAFAQVCDLHAAVIGEPPAGHTGAARQVWEFTASLDAPGQARHLVAAALHDCGAGHLAGDAAIIVTEFATNAVVHARSGFTVTLTTGKDTVRISVRDAAPLPAGSTALPAKPLHGLGAVAAMAARWGAKPASGGGKDVWAELSR